MRLFLRQLERPRDVGAQASGPGRRL